MTDLWITLGPSSLEQMDELINLGVRGVRLTFSFGTPALQAERARKVKASARDLGLKCLTIADLPGEKIRLGMFEGNETVAVDAGQLFDIVISDIENPTSSGRIPLPHPGFVSKLQGGEAIIIGDGSLILRVEKADQSGVKVRSECAGVMNHTRGVTLQGGSFIPRCLTRDDEEGLRFISTSSDFDMIAISFVSSAEDVLRARSILKDQGSELPLVAKIETARGIDHLDEICAVADMVMAARGDLALCMPWTELPKSVALIADSALEADTPWVLATQVAEGMERFAFPTRAEICDLAHWLERGCAAVMLSYETVFGGNARGAVACTQQLLDRWSSNRSMERQ